MAVRIAIVGPGRVGTTLGDRFAAAGAHVLGYLGRDRARAAAAVAALAERVAGRPRVPAPVVLEAASLATAHVVLFAVGDPDLERAVVAAADAGGARRCSLWLHTSGRHGLDVFAPIAAAHGVRVGALHPVLPFPAGALPPALDGAPAVLLGESRARRLLRRLVELLGMQPWFADQQDRARYHAACALAANGTTALLALVEALLDEAGGLPPAAGRQLAASLAAAAVHACRDGGPRAALSGPVRRGDAVTVAVHLNALGDGIAADVYRALMQQALQLAREGGLDDDGCARVAAALQ